MPEGETMSFVSREMELALLDDLYRRPDAQFLILYGRRRIGKTALVTRWGGGLEEPLSVLDGVADVGYQPAT
ncbi:archaeal ATPase, fused to C-terminal DUF234 domain [hydrothermal vent metagenome]|uniref:Archaeal ATPase, fused to C-terminal DUF234 domain n=1 Tax=hydrothermal vent metagenome TaxID=652676 RepID=A0A3B0UQM8_9ZZZZ